MDARRLMGLLVGAGVIVLGGCGGGGSPGGGNPDAGSQNVCTIEGVSVTALVTSVSPGTEVDLGANVKQGQNATGCNGGVTWASNPAGPTIGTQPGGAAKFQTSTPGTYTVTATSVDDHSKFGSVSITVRPPSTCGTANGTVVTHSGNITASDTWAGNGVTHSVTSSVRIKPGATVTVEACAIVAVAAGQEIGVEGDTTGNVPAKLVAAGTDVDHFVTFTSAAQGQTWAGIRGYNVQSLVEMHWAGVLNAGAGAPFDNAAIVMAGPGLNQAPVGVLTADQLVIGNPVGAGILLDGMAAFTPQSTALGVSGAPGHPIEMHLMAAGSIPVTQVQNSTHDDALMLTSKPNVTADTTLNGNIPLFISSQVTVGQPVAGTTTTLTIQRGAVLRFASGSNLRMFFGIDGAGTGVLLATGDAARPIVFTSAASSKNPGDWAGLLFLNSAGSQLSYVTIEYAGGDNLFVSTNCRPNGSSDNAAMLVAEIPGSGFLTNSTIQFSAGHGIDATWKNSTDNSPDIAAGNTFNSNQGLCKQTFNGVTTGSCPSHGCTE